MRCFILAATLLSTPAMAAEWKPQEPIPGSADPRICTVDYDPNRVLQVRIPVLKKISIRVGPEEMIVDDPVSNEIDLIRAQSSGSLKNILYLRAQLTPMEPTPIGLRTQLKDGTTRDYNMEISSYDEHEPVQVASKDGTTSMEIPAPKPYCFQISYHYPADVKKTKTDALTAAQAKKKDQEDEIALHQASPASRNNHYVAQGDASIAPAGMVGADAIWDDGFTTTLNFPGNMTIPTILTRFDDGALRQPDGITHEYGGVVKLHGVYAYLKLVDGNKVLCVFNRGFSAIGRNPGTGTSSPDIERTVGSQH